MPVQPSDQLRTKPMTTWEFPAPEPISLEARLPAGDITVSAEDVTTATVSLTPARSGKRGEELIAGTTVEFDGGKLTVIVPDRLRLLSSTSLDLVVRLPRGSSCQLKAASADIRCTGELGSVDARSASGDVSVEQVTGAVSINTASGDVRLKDAAAAVQVNTACGDVTVSRAEGSVKARSASGDVRISSITAGRGEISTVSGDISVAVPGGIGVYLDLSAVSGDVRSDLEPTGSDGDAALTLQCRSISGDVRVSRAG